jgi:NAD(P)-dependent dehydrogenase (short-subunit alcohol dehydrogenase family)
MTGMMNGRVVLVTGASRGIGRAVALAFAREGAMVAVAANTDEKGGNETVHLIEGLGGKGRFVKCDIGKAGDVKSMVDTVTGTFGRIDFACNNAGIGGVPVPLADVEETVFDQMININLKGVFLCMKYEIKQMLKQKNGVIVNIASMGSLFAPSAGASPYIAAKHGVMGLTKAAALEYAESGIRVNAVCPGVVETQMVTALPEEYREKLVGMHPVGRFGKPEEIAATVVWLCLDLSAFVTGTGVLVDGGVGLGARY